MKKSTLALLAAAFVAAAAAGCSGGVSTVPAAPGVPNVPRSTKTAPASFSILIPAKSTSARTPHYISASTQSVSIVETDAGATPSPATVANVTPGSPNCSSSSAGLTCTLTIAANVGTDTFTVKTFDQPSGAGTVLSTGALTATIVAGKANTTVPLVLGGVVKTLSVVLADPFSPVGGSGTTLNVTAKDPDGNTIVGTYDNAVSLSASGVTLGKTSLASSTDATNVTVTYKGVQTSPITITASGDGATASATLTPGSGIVYYTLGSDPARDDTVDVITQGPDGKIYYTTAGSFKCQTDPLPWGGSAQACTETLGNAGQLDPSTGSFSELQLSRAGFDLGFSPDGALWVGEFSALSSVIGPPGQGTIARISPFTQSGLNEITVPSPTPAPTATPSIYGVATDNTAHMTIGSDGNVWFTDEYGHQFGKVVTSGTPSSSSITTFKLSNPNGPRDIVMASDGTLWIANAPTGTLSQYSQSGALLKSYTMPEAASAPTPPPNGWQVQSYPYGVTTGSDGNFYLSDYTVTGYPSPNYLYRVTPTGTFTALPMMGSYSSTAMVASGNGAVAFTDWGYSAVVVDTLSTGSLRAIVVPQSSATAFSYSPSSLAFGSDNSLWFGCTGNYNTFVSAACVGHVVLTSTWTVSPSNVALAGTGMPAAQAISILESGDSAPFTVTSSNTSIAGVQSIANYDHDFLIVGNAPGTCTLTVTDKNGRAVSVPVSVTATSGTVQTSKRLGGL